MNLELSLLSTELRHWRRQRPSSAYVQVKRDTDSRSDIGHKTMIAIRIPSPCGLQHMRRKRRYTSPRDSSMGRNDLQVELTPSDDAVFGHRTRMCGCQLDDAVVEALEDD